MTAAISPYRPVYTVFPATYQNYKADAIWNLRISVRPLGATPRCNASFENLNTMTATVTRLDAARRQLCLALRLFFSEADAVSTHTLTCAAHEILSVLTRHSPNTASAFAGVKGSFIFENPLVRPEKKKEYVDMIRKDYNFFKHSGSDPSESVEFDSQRTEFFLFDAASMYRMLTGRWLYPGLLFYAWFSINHPNTVADETPMKLLVDKILQTPNGLSRAPRDRYLEFLNDDELRRFAAAWVDYC